MKISTKGRKKKGLLLAGKEPQSEEEYRALADALVKWAGKEDALNIDEFPLGLKIPAHLFREFGKKSDYFDRAFDISLRLIGCRREKLVHEGKMDRNIVMATMPLYDPEYKQWLLLKKQEPEEIKEPAVWNIYTGYPEGEPKLINSYTVPNNQ